MIPLLIYTTALVGPLYILLLVAISFGRRHFPEAQILFELSEPLLMLAAATLALALAGVIVQVT